MKNGIFIVLLFCLWLPVYSQIRMIPQDTVITEKGKDIIGKVTEVNPGYIVCSVGDSLNLENKIILSEKIIMIKYANGKTEIPIGSGKMTEVTENTAKFMLAKGKQDAKEFYKANSVFWITALLSLILLPLGYIVLIASINYFPKPEKWVVSDKAYLQDENYINGYKSQMRKKNIQKALLGILIGTGALILLLLVILVLPFL